MPRTPDSFPGTRLEEAICFYDQYGDMPSCYGGILYSDGYFYAKDAYGNFNLRIYVHPHVLTHIGGTDSFYVISNHPPTVNEDVNDGYKIGWRWIDTIDEYEYVCLDNSVGAAVWKNTVFSSGALLENHAPTHIHNGTDEIDGDKLDIDFVPSFYTPIITPSETDNTQDLTAHLAGIDSYLNYLDSHFVDNEEHKTLRHLIHFIDDGPAGGFLSGAFKEIIGIPWSSSEIWYESSAKLKKIVELDITRDSQKKPIVEEWKMYDTDGITVLVTVTDNIVYTGPFEINRTRTII